MCGCVFVSVCTCGWVFITLSVEGNSYLIVFHDSDILCGFIRESHMQCCLSVWSLISSGLRSLPAVASLLPHYIYAAAFL